MSEKLALSATLSVLMMSAFALFAPGAARAPLGPQTAIMPALSAPAVLLPTIR